MTVENFEVLDVGLNGINLVEASAGTGKTYSIALLFLRWILSEKYNGNIDSVVAVTFTNYAASELKERISAFLEEALNCLQNRISDKKYDPSVTKLCSEIPPEERDDAVKKLKTAVNGFDSASIFTIHGFCHRLILENAFEIQVPFDIELTEGSDIPHETAVSFFRNELSKESDRDFLNAAQSALTVKKFEDLMRKAGNSRGVRIDISENVVPGRAARAKLASVYSGFLEKIPEIIRKRREKTEKMTYDDLILSVYETLQTEEYASRLKNAMEKRYGLVMIDEFQDTDPVQYSIFRNLFFNGKHTVFLIGDPKQSIYSFRNADIFSYLETSEAVDKKYIMKTNYRSSAPVVLAVNNIFSKIGFGIKEIEYSGINPKNSDKNPLKIKKNSDFVPCPGMLVYEVAGDGEIISNIKERIKNMLRPDSNYRLGERNVAPSDIAVLTRTNGFALEIFDALNEEHIPVSFESGSGKGLSVFATPEAKVLFKLIKAAETRGESEFRTLLLTFFYHKKADDLLPGRDSFLQELHDEFTECFSEWDKKGFYYVFSKFIEKESVLSEIMAENIKTLNNIRHLAELINNFETTSGFSAANTADWFAAKLESPDESSSDEESVRNPGGVSDAVRIMTLHKSKGLEFNIVFFALSVKKRFPGNEWVPRHSYDFVSSGYGKIVSLEKSNSRDHGLKGDGGPEETREFYVGVTRAKYLTVYYLRKETYDGTVDRKLKNLLAGGSVQSVAYRKGGVSAETGEGFIFEDPLSQYRDQPLREPEDPGRDGIRATVLMSSFSGIVSANRSVNEDEYFAEKSGGMSDKNVAENTVENNKRQGDAPLKMSAFPKGIEPGLVLHSIFEKIDFQADDNSEIIREILKKWMNFEENGLENMVETVGECVRNVLNAPMFEGKALKGVKNCDKSAEMEFFLKIKGNVKKGQISRIIEENFHCEHFDEDSVMKGFMHGYIDLALKTGGKYYIVDWKSDFLGDSLEDYDSGKTAEEMRKRRYCLQYMIYTAAFDRYMTQADPAYSYSENFGGIRYVFLRGVMAGNACSGIFYDRPEESLLRDFQKLFEGEG